MGTSCWKGVTTTIFSYTRMSTFHVDLLTFRINVVLYRYSITEFPYIL